MQAAADGEVGLLGQGLLGEGELAFGVLGGRIAHVVGGAPIGFGDHLGIGGGEQFGEPAHGFRLLLEVGDLRHFVVMALDVGHLHHQHGMVRGHGAAALGEDMRVRQALRVAELLEHPDHHAGVVVHVVVDRAGIARVGAVVVHTQAAADVDVVHRQAEVAQFGVVADGFLEAVLVVGQVGDLRAHVEVQQAHALVQAGLAETLDHREDLRGGEAELGLLAAGVGPLGRGQGRQAHAQAHLRRDLELGGDVDDELDLGFLLDDDEDVVAELLPHQRQADELAVLVAVADDGAALRRQRQHGQQLGLGAGFQADGDVLGGDDVLHHRLLLVDLDRVQGGVDILVFEALDIGVEGTGQLAHALLQDVREAHQQRQAEAGLAQVFDLLEEIDGRALRAARTDFDATGLVDREKAGTPVANAIDTAAVGHGPAAAIVLARASCRHRFPPVG
ncbi:hypothetical protein D3C85_1020590 [compost metagenome]